MIEVRINANDAGQRLDKFLQKKYHGLPASLMYKAIRKKKIKVNRKRCDARQMLQEGDVIALFLPPDALEPALKSVPGYTGDIDVVYEDADILIVYKPAGLLSQSDRKGDQDTLLMRVRYYLYKKGEYDPHVENSFSPALCHRLDRNTEGLVIAAKNAGTLRKVNAAIASGKVHKTYLALAQGTFKEKKASLSFYIKKEETVARVSRTMREDYKPAKMDVEVLRQDKTAALCKVHLLTGRFHQIRAGLAAWSHPLIGDHKYGYQGKETMYKLCAYDLDLTDAEMDLAQSHFSVLPEWSSIRQKRVL